MHTARNLETGDNLHLSDKTLREEQLRKRKSTQMAPPPIKTILPGDTATQVSSQPKHKVSDMYLVTDVHGDKIGVQRILHPLTTSTTKSMGKSYNRDSKGFKYCIDPAQQSTSLLEHRLKPCLSDP